MFSYWFLFVFFQSFDFSLKFGGERAKSPARRSFALELANIVEDSSHFPHRGRQENRWKWASPAIFWSFATQRCLSTCTKNGRHNKTTNDDVFYVLAVFAPLGHAKATRILDGFYEFSGFSPRALRKRSKTRRRKTGPSKKSLKKSRELGSIVFWTLFWTPIKIHRLFT